MRCLAAVVVISACRAPDPRNALLDDRDRADVRAIRAHGWGLWHSLSGGGWDAWTPTEQLFDAHGRMSPEGPYFAGHVPTDFVWSIAFEAR